MKEYQSLLKDIKNEKIAPIYFLQGDETYFIDKLTEAIEKHSLLEEQRDFNQHVVYGLETKTDEVVALAKQFPFGADRQLIIVKEAQHLDLNKEEAREALLQYVLHPQRQTVLVFNFKNKKLNGNTKLSKTLKKQSQLYTSDALYDYQIPDWIKSMAHALQLQIDEPSVFLLNEYLGNALSAIDNELRKLKLILGTQGVVTPEVIEAHIGISKDFNNFELNRAVGVRNASKSFTILHYFEKNPKDHPMVLSISTLYNLFTKIIVMHAVKDKSDAHLYQVLKIPRSSFVLNEYKTAARNYNLKEATKALEYLQDVDLKSKGVGTTASNEPEILREFIYKTLYRRIV